MKSAEVMLKELILHARPPRGCAISLTERESSGPTDTNWVAESGLMAPHMFVRYNEKIAELRKTDQKIDWSGVKRLAGPRRIARSLSEIEGN